MKRILLSSTVLVVFSFSILLFQYSCKKTVEAQTPASYPNLNVTLISKTVQVQVGQSSADTSGNLVTTAHQNFQADYYLLNNTTGNLTKINIHMPAGIYVATGNGALSPDGKELIFSAHTFDNSGSVISRSIYSVAVDGSNLRQLIDGPYDLHGTY